LHILKFFFFFHTDQGSSPVNFIRVSLNQARFKLNSRNTFWTISLSAEQRLPRFLSSHNKSPLFCIKEILQKLRIWMTKFLLILVFQLCS